jgi:hypothetical protein
MPGKVVGVEIRPVHERMLDYALVAGSAGGALGATAAAAQGGALLHGAAWVGGHWVMATSVFIGVRHLMIRDNWREDREAVSGVAAATVCAGAVALRSASRRAIAPAGAVGFFSGFALHYLHRWWLRARLDWAEA